MKDLIAKLEAAEGPSRELDLEIYRLVIDADAKWFGGSKEFVTDPECLGEYGKRLPRFTSSIDAAMTLVPEGWGWALSSGVLRDSDEVIAGLSQMRDRGSRAIAPGEHNTPAIALCIAAMKAEQAMGKAND